MTKRFLISLSICSVGISCVAQAQDTLVVKTGEAILVKDLSIKPPLLYYRWATGDTTLKAISLGSIDHIRLSNSPRINAAYTPEQAVALKVPDTIRYANGFRQGTRDELQTTIKLLPTIGLGSLMVGAGIPYLVSPRSNGFEALGGIILIVFSVVPNAFTLATIPYTQQMQRKLEKRGMAYDPVYCKAYVAGRQERYLYNFLIVSLLGGASGVLLTTTQR